MRLIARLVALGVVAVSFATPVMACVMETATLTVSEAQCCRKMKGDCHNRIAPASHKCCRTLPGSPEAAATAKAAPPQLATAALATVSVAAPATGVAESFAGSSDSSPPLSPPCTNTVLRI